MGKTHTTSLTTQPTTPPLPFRKARGTGHHCMTWYYTKLPSWNLGTEDQKLPIAEGLWSTKFGHLVPIAFTHKNYKELAWIDEAVHKNHQHDKYPTLPKRSSEIAWLYHTLPPGKGPVRHYGVWDHEHFREDPVEIPYTNSERRHIFFFGNTCRERSHIPFHTFEHDFPNFSSLLGYGYPLPRGFAPKLKLISQGRPPWTVDPHIFCNVGGSSLRLMYTSLQAHSEIYIVFVEISPPSH